MRTLLSVIFSLLLTHVLAETEPSAEALEKWFESDELELPYSDNINEGELHFLATPPDKRVPTMANKIIILTSSLETGWVDIQQCHKDLDPISVVEIVYRYHQMRDLKILSTENIRHAHVVGQSVQLEDVGKYANLCVSLQARILYKVNKKQYVLRNGPFERRFLDGYFPVHVELDVLYPIDTLAYIGSMPAPAPGFAVRQTHASINIDAWFEGKLMTELIFKAVN